MSNTSKIILVTIVATCILLGLGYAAIQNITLNITGTASANVNQDNFDVSFVGTPTVSESTYATARIEDELSATIAVSGLTKAGQEVTATYDIKNNSSDLSADLKVLATSSDTEYFFISSKLAKSSLVAGESTTVTVTVKLTKTPIDGDVSTNIDIDLTAMPVQPGEEGTSEGVNDYAQAPDYRNEYGFYFDKAYTFVTEEQTVTVVLHEDGSVERYIDGLFDGITSINTAIYSDHSIDMTKYFNENVIATVSSDGTSILMLGYNGNLDEEYFDEIKEIKNEKNEYGFYFGKAYSKFINNSLISYVFEEDGSLTIYKDYGVYEEFEANTYSYSLNKAESVDEIIDFKHEGRIISISGYTLALDVSFWDRYNSVVYVKFGEAYITDANGHEQAMVFYEDGSSDGYNDGELAISLGEGTSEYSRDKITRTNFKNTYTVSEDGQSMVDNLNNVVYTLDTTFWSRYGLTKP